MNILTTKILTYTIAISLFLVVFHTRVHASGVHIALSPSVRYIVATPGSRIYLPYTVTNYGDDAYIAIEMKYMSWSPITDTFSFSPYQQKENEPIITSDVGENEHILLLSQEKHTGTLSISLPHDLAETEYRFSLLASNVPQQNFATRSSIGMRAAATSHVIIYASADPKDSTNITLSPPQISSLNSFSLFGKKIYLVDSSHEQGLKIYYTNHSSRTAFVKPLILFSTGTTSQTLYEGKEISLMGPGQKREIKTEIQFSFLPRRHVLTSYILTQPQNDISHRIEIISFPFVLVGICIGAFILLTTYWFFLRTKKKKI